MIPSLAAFFLCVAGAALGQKPGLDASPDCAKPCLIDIQPLTPCVAGQEPCACQEVLLSADMQSCITRQCSVADSLITFNVTSKFCDLPIMDRGEVLSVSGFVFASVDAVLIAIQLVTRPRRHNGWSDNVGDWVMVFNGGFVIAMAVLQYEVVQYGYGRDIWTLSFDEMTTINKLLYCHELMWSLILTSTRISILFFYRRVLPFEIMPKLKHVVNASILWTICGGITITLPLIFRCTPFEPQFNSFQNGPADLHCIDMQKHAWATGAINFSSDILLALLPVPALGKLRLHWRKKAGVCLMFCAGGFVTFASIPRMVSLMQYVSTFNPTYDWVYVSFWSATEAYVGVMCACMPRVYILVSRIYRHCIPAKQNSEVPKVPHLTSITVSTISSKHPLHNDLYKKVSL